VILDWIAATDVVRDLNLNAAADPTGIPVEENSLRPQLMEPDVLVSVAFTAEVRAGHRAVQLVEPVLRSCNWNPPCAVVHGAGTVQDQQHIRRLARGTAGLRAAVCVAGGGGTGGARATPATRAALASGGRIDHDSASATATCMVPPAPTGGVESQPD
jgi:hypothetical protein